MNTEEIISKVKDITEDYNSILSIEKAIELGLHGGAHNGSGDRTKLSKIFINITFYGSNANPNIYPKCYGETIDIDKDLIDKYKKERIAKGLPQEKGVIGFIIIGENKNETKNRPINPDIKKHYKKKACIICGTSKTVCDHKNDLYNDFRVLDIKTQHICDFQPICNNCNLRKRSVSLKTVKEKKRQPPPPAILQCFGISFTKGNEDYDPEDPDAMVGTYWYDPIAFLEECKKSIYDKAYKGGYDEGYKECISGRPYLKPIL